MCVDNCLYAWQTWQWRCYMRDSMSSRLRACCNLWIDGNRWAISRDIWWSAILKSLKSVNLVVYEYLLNTFSRQIIDWSLPIPHQINLSHDFSPPEQKFWTWTSLNKICEIQAHYTICLADTLRAVFASAALRAVFTFVGTQMPDTRMISRLFSLRMLSGLLSFGWYLDALHTDALRAVFTSDTLWVVL